MRMYLFMSKYQSSTIVGFGGGSDCVNMGSGVATTVVGGWKVSLALSISQFFSPVASDAAMHLDRVSINYFGEWKKNDLLSDS